MLIDARETLALAEMLRLRLSEEDARRLSGDLSAMLDYVRLLDEVDVSGIDPAGAGLDADAILRDDVPAQALTPADLESMSGGAFDHQAGAFVVPPLFRPAD
ncbi:MAG: Asp-tRNA(Asn)/Glu-tRNA(Gln) amidotransferase subunit GatC [Planctomycetota bacterium]|jgi:aspartyl-tRNA(Asn)/glutamyl-tRNA(Gln) amidotransferase subunit C|nr:Asp-tRNA(Asn)/Glu-tRNA(Gln) amidotransferase subunit GatC [Planctomycetota bacterium]